jgi:hypothetical protein
MILKSFLQPPANALALAAAPAGPRRPVPGPSPANTPLVTVIGGGIAGLTAAHELTERGFDVQVVESAESFEHPGQVDVGGLARSQYGRIKSPIHELHKELLEKFSDPNLGGLAKDLYNLLLFTRSPFVQTEPAVRTSFTAEFDAGLPKYVKPALKFAALRVWKYARLNTKSEKKLENLLSRAGASEYLTAVKLLRDFEWTPVALKEFRKWVATEFANIEKWGYEEWKEGADSGGVVACRSGFEHATDPSARATLLDDVRSRLDEALRIRRARFAFNLTNLRHEGRAKTAEELDIAQQAFKAEPAVESITQEQAYLTKARYEALEGQLDASDFASLVLEEINKGDRPLPGTDQPGDKKNLALQAFCREILQMTIYGHASSEGDLAMNLAVAAARAKVAHADLLTSADPNQHDIIQRLTPHIHPAALGEQEPIDRNDTDAGRRRNRRATLVVDERVVPGEHGFRFFPRHYKNVFELLRRIPILDEKRRETEFTVLDNLLPTDNQELGLFPIPTTKPPRFARSVLLRRTLPRSFRDFHDAAASFLRETGATLDDVRKFQLRAFRYLTSGSRRRWNEYETLPWSHFIGLEPGDETIPDGWSYSDAMRVQLEAAAQALLAYSVSEADTHSYGNFSMQTIVDQLDMDRRVDFILNGPTTDAWLRPWRAWLKAQGVQFFRGEIKGVKKWEQEILPTFAGTPVGEDGALFEGAHFVGGMEKSTDQLTDFFVLAIPLTPIGDSGFNDAQEGDFVRVRTFGAAVKKENALRDMSGMQMFFETSVRWGHAHVYFPQAWWGISTITQTTRWRVRARRRDGFMGVVSIDVSDWRPKAPRPGPYNRTPVAIAAGVHRQIEWGTAPTKGGTFGPLPAPDYFHIDDGMIQEGDLRLPTVPITGTRTKYLGNLKGQFVLRPGLKFDTGAPPKVEYQVAHNRWVLAGAHMATFTRMMTMEGSCESGMHATNAILAKYGADDGKLYNGIGSAAGSSNRPLQPTQPCNLEDDELADLRFLKELDDELASAGLPHILTLLQAERLLLANERLLSAARLTAEAERDLREIGNQISNVPKTIDELSRDVIGMLEKHVGPFDATGSIGSLPSRLEQLKSALAQIRGLILGTLPGSTKPPGLPGLPEAKPP